MLHKRKLDEPHDYIPNVINLYVSLMLLSASLQHKMSDRGLCMPHGKN